MKDEMVKSGVAQRFKLASYICKAPVGADEAKSPMELWRLLVGAKRPELLAATVEIDGYPHVLRFLRPQRELVPVESFRVVPRLLGDELLLMVRVGRLYLLRKSLEEWIGEKGPARTVGVVVSYGPETRRMPRVVELRDPEHVLLSDGTLAEARNLRILVSWELLPSGLRRKTMSINALSPDDRYIKAKYLVKYACEDAREAGERFVHDTFWGKDVFEFQGGRSRSPWEVFKRGSFLAGAEAHRCAVLLPGDPQWSLIRTTVEALLRDTLPRMRELGLDVDFPPDLRLFYHTSNKATLQDAVAQLSALRPDAVVGVVVPGAYGDRNVDPYFYTKRELLAAGIPSQMIKVGTVRRFAERHTYGGMVSPDIWKDEFWRGFVVNFALKLGAVPWQLTLPPDGARFLGVDLRWSGATLVWFNARGVFQEALSFRKHEDALAYIREHDSPLLRVHFLESLPEHGLRMASVLVIRDSALTVAPRSHHIKLLSGFWFRLADEPTRWHLATEGWTPYREYNLYEVVVDRGEDPEALVEEVFWLARAYISTFPTGAMPITTRFAAAMRKALLSGLGSWGESSPWPWFI